MQMAPRFHVILLPRGETVLDHCTLDEALAFQQGYHEVVQHGPREAVIAAGDPPCHTVPSLQSAHSKRTLPARVLMHSA